jgi:hypothetical protein
MLLTNDFKTPIACMTAQYTKSSVSLGNRQALYYIDVILYICPLSAAIYRKEVSFFVFRKVSGIFQNRSGNVNPRILNVNRVM